MASVPYSADGNVASQDPTKSLPQLECTGHMVSSFIFSKPGFSLAPFVSWQSSAKPVVDLRRSQRQAAVNRQPSHQTDHRTDGLPTALPLSQPDAASWNLHLRSVAWKRRSFVEAVERVPPAYHHRSVVPSVHVSPRAVGAYHHVAAVHPLGAALPHEACVAPQPKSDVPVGHPVHRVQAFIADIHQQMTQEAARCRMALTQRVTHVQDEEVRHVLHRKQRPTHSAPAVRRDERWSNEGVSPSMPEESLPAVVNRKDEAASPQNGPETVAAMGEGDPRQPLPVGIRRRSAPSRPAGAPSVPS